MFLHSLWIQRKGEDTPELLTAWDEYSVDANPDGYDADCEKALASCDSDVEAYRYILLKVDINAIDKAFNVTIVNAEVTDAS